MVASWVHGKRNLVSHRGGHATRRDRFTGISEYDLGWTGGTLETTLPSEAGGRNTLHPQGQPREICGRLHHHWQHQGTPGDRGLAIGRAVSERPRSAALARENPHHAYQPRIRL